MSVLYLAIAWLLALSSPAALRVQRSLSLYESQEDEELSFGQEEEEEEDENTPKPIPRGLFWREANVWRMAAQEARINSSRVSAFAENVAKFPASWVQRVTAMDHNKTMRYNFQGSLYTWDVKPYRAWVGCFAEKHFGPEDYFRITDAPEDYKHLSAWDRSMDPGGFRPKSTTKNITKRWFHFDAEYFGLMSRSQFTLCPRGDRAYSYRFYEAALSRSIPVVSNIDMDLAERNDIFGHKVLQGLRCIGYHYYSLAETQPPFEYREDWAEENYRLFIKYQTFLEGDNVPPNCTLSPF